MPIESSSKILGSDARNETLIQSPSVVGYMTPLLWRRWLGAVALSVTAIAAATAAVAAAAATAAAAAAAAALAASAHADGS